MDSFTYHAGRGPLLVSMPHTGTHIPDALAQRMTEIAHTVPDTDWHLERLYDFLDALGASVLIATHSGSTVTGLSGMELDTTSDAPAADASNQLLILRAINREDNDTTLTHAKVAVLINQHTENQGTVGTLGI